MNNLGATFMVLWVITFICYIIKIYSTNIKRTITKKVEKLGGEVISIKSYTNCVNNYNSSVKEAIRLRDELKEESIYDISINSEKYLIYDIKYLLNNEEKKLYLFKYRRIVTCTGSKKFDLEWVDEEKIDAVV